METLWNGAVDAMIGIPGLPAGETAYFVPAKLAKKPNACMALLAIPAIFQHFAVFALTAWNPQGVVRDIHANTLANVQLRKEINNITQRFPSGSAIMWDAFGFDESAQWREDGFCVGFAGNSAALGKTEILRLGKMFDQAAVFEYKADTVNPEGELIRKIVDCASGDTTTESPVVCVRWSSNSFISTPNCSRFAPKS
eukprot:c6111_g1_i2.p1 GENE.c6111_g1_i2~~c6111_g1_i2.p1  ORF type:complete len:197 (-),score=32.18 c6111_g1_i2:92-682(-)